MFEHNKNFYPTPEKLIGRMISRIKGRPNLILDPQAGKGDIVEALKKRYDSRHCNGPDIQTMEIDPELQACLRGKGIKLLDSDFLAYTGPDKFDLIIMNPPFDDGDLHLSKALDIMYRGQVISLLNAETLRNPYSNTRKALVRRLEEMGAYIEFIPNAFSFADAERKTDVEVALVDVFIDRKVEDDLFVDATDWSPDAKESFSDKYEISTGRTVEELVAEYNETIQAGTDVIVNYYKNYRKIGGYLKLNDHDNKMRSYQAKELTEMMQGDLNNLLRSVRTSFWRRTLNLEEVRSRMTRKKQAEFEEGLKLHQNMDFTEGNIRMFVLNLIGGYEQTITDAVIDIFDLFTVRHCYHGGPNEKNVHMFSGWKTNSAFKCNRRIVVHIGYKGSWDGPFTGYQDRWQLNHDASDKLRDIDLVMSYFNGGKKHYSLQDAVRDSLDLGRNSGESTFFKFIAHKKGTIHLTFRDEDILRRFNVVACRGKGWLPGDFGSKPYKELSFEERTVVNSFEGQETYDANVNVPLIGNACRLVGLPYLPLEANSDLSRLAA